MMPESTHSAEKCLHLSELTKDGSLPKTANAQYPGMHCPFRAVAGTVTLIKNAYALLLGPAICQYNAKHSMSLRSLTSDPRPNNFLFLEYTQDDVIFGFHNKINYGNGASLAVYASAWKKDKDLSDVFIYWNGYAYGKGFFGEESQERFIKQLKSVNYIVDEKVK